MIRILPDPVSFEWDKGNIDKNYIKHKVTNQEAEEVFSNEPLIISEDVKHSFKEIRFKALGKTNKDRRLFASFMIRNDKVRVISIRDMNKKEVMAYEKA
jgi:uncharacterized DUF497 family protein